MQANKHTRQVHTMSGAEHVGMNVMWSDTAGGMHCYTAHQVLPEAHHHSVHRVLEVVSNNMFDQLNKCSVDWMWNSAEKCGWLTDA